MSATTAMVVVVFVTTTAANAATFVVNRTDDDGDKHTLRWAINESNALNLSNPTPGRNRILIVPRGAGAFVVRPIGDFLPPLVGPVVVQGLRTGGAIAESPSVIVDGSNLVPPRTPSACPGATHTYDFASARWVTTVVSGTGPNVRGYYGAGLAVHDSHDVEIFDLEIRNFCAGVVVLRSHDVNVHDVRIVDHHGAAGVIFTGDDGAGGVTDLGFSNRLVDSVLLDNGDGFEIARGNRDSLLEGTYIALTQPLPVDGNAVEFVGNAGNNNRLIGNIFTRYQIISLAVNGGNNHVFQNNDVSFNLGPAAAFGGNDHLIQNNDFSNNGGVGVSLNGARQRFEQNAVFNNGGVGVSLTSNNSQQNSVSRNAIHNNGGLGIDIAPTGVNPNDAGDVDTGPNGRQNFPVLVASSTWTATAITLVGSLSSAPNQTYTLEFFVSRAVDPSGHGEGEVFLGSARVTTDATGNASFSVSLLGGNPFGDGATVGFFTATATDSAGATSEFSAALSLTRL
jgi:3-dehydroshikimate dehydratase